MIEKGAVIMLKAKKHVLKKVISMIMAVAMLISIVPMSTVVVKAEPTTEPRTLESPEPVNMPEVTVTPEATMQLSQTPKATMEPIITPYSAPFDNKAHDALAIEFKDGSEVKDYTIEYTIDDEEPVSDIPQIKNVGKYEIKVHIQRDEYEDYENTFEAEIKKISQECSFNNDDYNTNNRTEEQVDIGVLNENKEYDFSAKIDSEIYDSDGIKYSVEWKNSLEQRNINDVATIDNAGKLVVKDAGEFIIKAMLNGNDNLDECVISHELKIIAVPGNPGDLIKFADDISYVFGSADGTISTATAAPSIKNDTGLITYSIDKQDIGISCDSSTGEINISDYNTLADAIANSAEKQIDILVSAHKAAGNDGIYAEDDESYGISITFETVPDEPYTMPDIDGNNGWYKSETEIKAKQGYKISDSINGNYQDSIKYSNNNGSTKYMYLKKIDGGITDKIAIEDMKIDTNAPEDIKIVYSKSVGQQVLEALGITRWFYNSTVDITFKAKDELSGVDKFSYELKGTDEKGEVKVFEEDKDAEGYYTATIKLPESEAKMLEGKMIVTVYDNAGNETLYSEQDDKIIVIDKISPEIEVQYSEPNEQEDGTKYYNDDVEMKVLITEDYFNADAVNIKVNGVKYDANVEWSSEKNNNTGIFTLSGDGKYTVTIDYTDYAGNTMAEYISDTIIIDSEDPIIQIDYSSGDENDGENTDVKNPIDKERRYFNKDCIATITVTENNFRADEIAAYITAKDISGNDIEIKNYAEYLSDRSNWKPAGDNKYEAEIIFDTEANYTFGIGYKDLAGNEVNDYTPDKFTVDKNLEEINISYSGSIINKIISNLTYGFYKEKVTVTLTAKDSISGIDYFQWKYTKQEKSSDINMGTTQITNIIPSSDKYSDGQKNAEVSFEIEADARGHITAEAYDRSANTSSKEDKEHILVVDKQVPGVTVSYEAVDEANTKVHFVDGSLNDVEDFASAAQAYYDGAVTATIEINEANFFDGIKETKNEEEEVIHNIGILLTKTDDKGQVTKTEYLPNEAKKKYADADKTEYFEWSTDNDDQDVHTMSIKYEEDADYVLTFEYTDISENEADITANDGKKATNKYESKPVTVDTVSPVIEVEYTDDGENTDVKNPVDKGRRYFNKDRKATITVTEHNFRADEIAEIAEITEIKAKDISDDDIKIKDYAGYLSDRSNWKPVENEDNKYKAEITFDTEANYTVDIGYKDLAGNEINDYTPDKFTIDKTENPTEPEISYSQSIIGKVIDTLTYGFYKEKVTVTLTAKDSISGIDYFQWKYTKQEKSSDINMGTTQITDIIPSSDEYSDRQKKAEVSFEIEADARGYITAEAYDRSANTSSKEDDEHILVVDSKMPGVTVSYKAVDEANTKVHFVDGSLNDVEDFASAAQAYYDGAVTATIEINEANFFDGIKETKNEEEEVIHNIGILLTKTDDKGQVTKTEYLPNEAKKKYADADKTEYFEWSTDNADQDVHTMSIRYEEDADYVLTFEYADLSENEADITANDGKNAAKTYESKPVTVDTVSPVIEVGYTDDGENTEVKNPVDKERRYFNKDRKATITVTEHNFRADEIAAEITAKDISDDDIKIKDYAGYLSDRSNWKPAGDNKYEAEITYDTDANYTFNIGYKDLAGNKSIYKDSEGNESDAYTPDKFTVDKNLEEINISYSGSIINKIISNLTYGFYKEKVTVTLTAKDSISGIDYFQWKYTKQEKSSDINMGTTQITDIIPSSDEYSDRQKKAEVSFEIEADARGYITAEAYDRSANTSSKEDDEHILVVDSKMPGVTVSYKAVDEANTKVHFVDGSLNDVEDFASAAQAYYDGAVTATIEINEANFFDGIKETKNEEEEVIHNIGILLTKTDDKGQVTKTEYLPNEAKKKYADADKTEYFEWSTDNDDQDVHTMSIKYEEDADYVLTFEYTDLSENEADITTNDGKNATKTYESKPVTVDTMSPVIEVEYTDDGENIEVKNPVDKERRYFNKDRKATITVTEHNFRADEIAAEITAKDISDDDIKIKDYAGYLSDRSNWKPAGDNKYEAEITYDTDANYTFNIGYKDLAGNKSIYKDSEGNESDEYTPDKFTVDKESPIVPEISYSQSIIDKVIGILTYGFYNPDVTVTLKSSDKVSGIDYFKWKYTKQEGASIVNKESTEYAVIKPDMSNEYTDDNQTATVSFKIDAQTRGYITAEAYDRSDNTSSKEDDSFIKVVDSISPEVNISYKATDEKNTKVQFVNESAYTVQDFASATQAYYNGNVTATVTINEANFFEGAKEIKNGKEEVVHNIGILLTKTDDKGVVTKTEYLPEGAAGKYTDANYVKYFVWNTDKDIHTMTIDYAENADYVLSFEYTDLSKNSSGISSNDGLNTVASYTSKIVTVDKTAPVIKVNYSNNNVKNTIKKRDYLDNKQVATITVTEHNFRADDIETTLKAVNVVEQDVKVKDYASYLSGRVHWKHYDNAGNQVNDVKAGDIHVAQITYDIDANYTFDIAYADLARNNSADYKQDKFTVDTIAPKKLAVSYSTNVFENILSSVTFGYYNAQMTVTISAEDETAGIWHFEYSYVNEKGVSNVNAQLIDQAIKNADITYEGKKATATFKIPRTALNDNNQFNGTVNFTAYDRSEISNKEADKERIIVDNIAPTATITYNDATNIDNGILYYNGDINATIEINEANFYAEDVEVAVTRNDAAVPVTVNWVDNNVDVHTGTFTLTEDGDYFVTVNYKDKSNNQMQEYTSEQMTIDTDIAEAVITVNGEDADGKAFNNDVVLGVAFDDKNYESYELSLTRTRYADKDVDVTDTYIDTDIPVSETGGSATFDTFNKVKDTDGIYTIEVTLHDKAGHTIVKKEKFTINRFGSVYEYSDNLITLIQDGGAYVQSVADDLIITEYNADRLVSQSLDISKDGKPVEDVAYTVTPNISEQTEIGDSGWYQYQYTISKDNFNSDGVYKISVSSKDATGNTPENTPDNTNYEKNAILFRVDSTAPEINSIIGLEDKIINATDVNVEYTVYDTIGLKSMVVEVNGAEVSNITDFTEDAHNYSGNFNLKEANAAQSVRLVVTDLAGNVTDTSSEGYKPAFSFNSPVTISTNFFVRWYANKILFWGAIGGFVLIVVGIAVGIILLKRRKKDEE